VSLLVTGSIGIDTVKTPYGISENCLGGSAAYFAMAASFFCPVRLVGAVGSDCPFDLTKVFADRDVDLSGLEIRQYSKTFRWTGSYFEDMDERKTERLELNVLAEAPPKVPATFRNSEYVFLANTAPSLQHELLEQVENPVFVAADTMDCWITKQLDDLKTLLKRVDCLVINEDEARMLAGEQNLIKAAEDILRLGPSSIVVKKGGSGSITCNAYAEMFILPGYPAKNVKDPTGAGDSFAGAMLGYVAQTDRTDFETLKTAVAYGTIVASFTIADFSLQGLTSITKTDIDSRLRTFRKLTQF
jgi:sugar/nucleoside kinase (ribokinase family)